MDLGVLKAERYRAYRWAVQLDLDGYDDSDAWAEVDRLDAQIEALDNESNER